MPEETACSHCQWSLKTKQWVWLLDVISHHEWNGQPGLVYAKKIRAEQEAHIYISI